MIMQVSQERCVGCAYRHLICPESRFKVNGKSQFIGKDSCRGCLRCLKTCPTLAIEIVQ